MIFFLPGGKVVANLLYWTETTARRGTDEVNSCLHKSLSMFFAGELPYVDPEEYSDDIDVESNSDACGGQNQSSYNLYPF